MESNDARNEWLEQRKRDAAEDEAFFDDMRERVDRSSRSWLILTMLVRSRGLLLAELKRGRIDAGYAKMELDKFNDHIRALIMQGGQTGDPITDYAFVNPDVAEETIRTLRTLVAAFNGRVRPRERVFLLHDVAYASSSIDFVASRTNERKFVGFLGRLQHARFGLLPDPSPLEFLPQLSTRRLVLSIAWFKNARQVQSCYGLAFDPRDLRSLGNGRFSLRCFEHEAASASTKRFLDIKPERNCQLTLFLGNRNVWDLTSDFSGRLGEWDLDTAQRRGLIHEQANRLKQEFAFLDTKWRDPG